MKINFEQVTTMPLNSTWPVYHNGSFMLVLLPCKYNVLLYFPRKIYCLGIVARIIAQKSMTVLLTKAPFLGYA
jgi:hypothetical protein